MDKITSHIHKHTYTVDFV